MAPRLCGSVGARGARGLALAVGREELGGRGSYAIRAGRSHAGSGGSGARRRAIAAELREKVVRAGRLRIDPYGELAGILGLCEESKAPGRDRALAEQIKVVAGARNHLNLLFDAPGLRRA